jgi:hypothetical protein
MATAIAQPIAGVSANRETEIEVIYPSVAGGFLGGIIGNVMGIAAAIPSGKGIAGTVLLAARLTLYVALGAVCVPLVLLAYPMKAFGYSYVVTNRSVQQRSFLGGSMSNQVALGDIVDIEITTESGYEFHRVRDLNLQNSQGATLMTIAAIPYPERLCQVIFDAREARVQSDDAFAAIQARE